MKVRLETPPSPSQPPLYCPDVPNISMLRPHLRDIPTGRPLEEGYTLRPLGHSDEPGLAQLLSLAFSETWNEARVQTALTRAEDVRAVYGVFWKNTVVATASSQTRPDRDPKAGFVHWVAAHPEHRGRGLAAALLGRVLTDFSERGDLRARLDTQPERLPAIRAYLRFGFVPEYDRDGVDQRAVWSEMLQKLMSKP